MKKFFLLCILGILTSCVSLTSQNQEKLNSWYGASESDLIRSWGMPNSTYNLKDEKFVAFEKSSMHSYQGTAHTSYCKVTFTLINDKVAAWNYNDDLCFDFIKAR